MSACVRRGDSFGGQDRSNKKKGKNMVPKPSASEKRRTTYKLKDLQGSGTN
jgi:hypothetical protein